MKKRLPSNELEAGFYLPYTIFVSMIVFVVIGTSIAMYQNNVHNTHKLLELIEVETMTQMAKTEFLQDELYRTESNGQVNYIYPYGKVVLAFTNISDDTWQLSMEITTKSKLLINKIYTIIIE